jgi:NifU-like protein
MSSESRRRLVCRCLGVASSRIFAAARSEGLADVAAVTKSVRAGGGCTLCHPEIEEILAEVRGEPIEAALAIENQAVCRQETLARVEGSLASLVSPRLAASGARVVEVRVEGLDVAVRVTGSTDPELLRLVARILRSAVCDDLEVQVEIAP